MQWCKDMDMIALFNQRWEKISSNSVYDMLSADELIEVVKKKNPSKLDESESFDMSVQDPKRGNIPYHISLIPLNINSNAKGKQLLLVHGYDLNRIKEMEADLSESKKALEEMTIEHYLQQEDLLVLSNQLEEKNEYLSMVLDRTPIATITADSNGRVEMINPSARELLEVGECEGKELTLSGIFKMPIEMKDGKYQRINLTRGGGVTIPIMASISTFGGENELAGVVMTLTDITDLEGIHVVPSKEISEVGESRDRIEEGEIYLFDEEKPSKIFDVFVDGVKHGREGLCITRMNPKKIRARYDLENTPIVWLVKNKIPSETCLSPNELSLCYEMIDNFVKHAENGLILIEGVEYLMAQNSFSSIHKFFQLVNDCVMPSNSSTLTTIDPATLTTQDFHLIKREMDRIAIREGEEDG